MIGAPDVLAEMAARLPTWHREANLGRFSVVVGFQPRGEAPTSRPGRSSLDSMPSLRHNTGAAPRTSG